MFIPVHVTPTPGRYRCHHRRGEGPDMGARRETFDVLAFGTDAEGQAGLMVLLKGMPEWHPSVAFSVWGIR